MIKGLPAARRGFTLIELLVVIGVLAVLLTITLIAINPARQFAQANNTRRRSDVNAVLNAVSQYSADHHGNLTALALPVVDATHPAPSSPNLCKDGTTACVDQGGATGFCHLLVPTYVTALPGDPSTATGGTATGDPITDCDTAAYNTGYIIYQVDLVSNGTTNHRVIVAAPGAELGDVISVTR